MKEIETTLYFKRGECKSIKMKTGGVGAFIKVPGGLGEEIDKLYKYINNLNKHG